MVPRVCKNCGVEYLGKRTRSTGAHKFRCSDCSGSKRRTRYVGPVPKVEPGFVAKPAPTDPAIVRRQIGELRGAEAVRRWDERRARVAAQIAALPDRPPEPSRIVTLKRA